jgi:hypothetical protein
VRVPTTIIEIPVEGAAVAFVLCTPQEEERLAFDLASRDVAADAVHAVVSLLDSLVCDDDEERR